MRTLWLSVCAGLVLAAMPCQAQQASGEAAPFLYVYVTKFGENALPRITLGLEKPALKISAFEKCIRTSDENPKLMGLAAQLKADDLKTLIAAIKALGTSDARELPDVVLWFTTPDNKALDFMNPGMSSGEANLVNCGVLMFDSDSEKVTVRYLNQKLHPQ